MYFIPEEFKQSILIRINNFEAKLPNCQIEDFMNAYKTFINMIFMNFDIYITKSFGEKLLECNLVDEQVELAKTFIRINIENLKEEIQKDNRRILN